jgi:colicin import membrane protein
LIKKEVKEQVEKQMNLDFAKKMEEIKKRTEEEVRDKIAQEEEERKQKQKAIKEAEDAAEEAKHVAEKKAEEEEMRKLTKAEAKKEAMRLAVRRQADEILAKQEYRDKIALAAHKYNLILTDERAYKDHSDSES